MNKPAKRQPKWDIQASYEQGMAWIRLPIPEFLKAVGIEKLQEFPSVKQRCENRTEMGAKEIHCDTLIEGHAVKDAGDWHNGGIVYDANLKVVGTYYKDFLRCVDCYPV